MKKKALIFPMDNSGIIHMAVHKLGHSNTFRLFVDLQENIQPEVLQAAFQAISPQFPMLVAGIQAGLFKHFIIPVEMTPDIFPEVYPLSYMSRRQLRQCAMRVLYGENRIAVEFFHSLTDGYGGMIFLKALLNKYLYMAHGVHLSGDEQTVNAEDSEDSYLVYAGRKKAPFHMTISYLPGQREIGNDLHTTTGIFKVQNILDAAHDFHVSVTTFLAAVMAQSVMELQIRNQSDKSGLKPIQIMVPINLRGKFPSKTLRNFALYALPRMEPEDRKLSLQELIYSIEKQMTEQFAESNLKSMMAANTSLDSNCLLRWMPLLIKYTFLKIGFYFFGGRNSSLTLSNLGRFDADRTVEPYIRQAGFILSTRLYSSYNCGVITCKENMYINFSRNTQQPELEKIFFDKLLALNCCPTVFLDEQLIPLEDFLNKDGF